MCEVNIVLIRNANSQRINVPLRLALVVAAFVFLVTALVCGLGTSRSALAQEAKASSSLSFVDDPLKLKFSGEDGNEITTDVVIRNSDDQRTNLVFSTVLTDAEGKPQEVDVEPQSSSSVRPYSITPVKLKIDTSNFKALSMPLKGFLVISAEEDQIAPETLSLTVSEVGVPPPIFNAIFGTYNAVLIVPFVVSFGVVFACYLWYRRRTQESRKSNGETYVPLMGQESAFGTGLGLDFSKSWATLITIVAGLLTAFTGADIFSEERKGFTDNEITSLALSFGGLLIVAPAIYNGIRWRTPEPLEEPEEAKDSEKPDLPVLDKELELQGYILPLLLASAILLGALFGQIVLVFLLISEVDSATITSFAKGVLYLVTAGAALYAAVYTWSGVRSCLKEKVQWEKESEEWKQRVQDRRQQSLDVCCVD